MAGLRFASTHSHSSFIDATKFPQILRPCTTYRLVLKNAAGLTKSLRLQSNGIHCKRSLFIAGEVIVRASPIAVSEGEKEDAFKEVSEDIKSGPKLDSTGGGGQDKFGGGGGEGGGGGGGEGEGEEQGGGGGKEERKQMALSMSQKFTLGYAALLGLGGLIGYAKRKSSMSLMSGGLSALVLYYVHTQLPTNPVFASSVGLGISAVFLTLMGARFRTSGKMFPAGVISLISLIMTGGYLHGILRSSHA